MYINRTRIRCGSLASGGLALAGSALISGAIFLPWWDVGDPKELLNLDNAPPVVATLWGFVFDNPPSWVTKPRGREASTWEAYCQRDAQALYTTTLTTLPLDILPDNPLHPGTCDMLPMLPTLLLTAAGLGPGAALCFFLARCGISLLALLTGAALAGTACACACSSLFFAGLLSMRGLFSASGPQCILGGMAFAGGSAVLAVYNSVKALDRSPKRQVVLGGEAEVSDEEAIEPEERQAQLKAEARLSRMDRLKVAQDRRARQMERNQSRKRKKKVEAPKSLARVLRWGRRKGQGGRFGKTVPAEWLDEAFREIDVADFGEITMEQFMDAVELCGYKTKRVTFEDILREMDEEKKFGVLDQQEFVRFFRYLEDSLKQEANRKWRALLPIFFCNFCFFAHVVGMSVILLLVIRQEAGTPVEELDAIRRAERELINTAFQLVGVSLFCFFIVVVVLPLLRVSVGASLDVWWNHFAGVWRVYLARWRGEEIHDDDDDPHRGSKDSMESKDPEALTPSVAETPHLSRRTSRASLGSQQSFRSNRSSLSGGSLSSASRKKKGVLRRVKGFVDSLILPPKQKRRRRSENLKYDTTAFEKANMRALASQVEQVSTFSLMQVRDLRYCVPDPTTVAPPSLQQPPLLPGTPAGLAYSVSNPELLDRPGSPDFAIRDRQAYTDR